MWGALLVGVAAVRAGRMDGVLLAGIALIPLVAFELVSGLPAATQTLQRVRRAAARVQEVLDTPPPVTSPSARSAPSARRRAVRRLATLQRTGTPERPVTRRSRLHQPAPQVDSHEQLSHTLRARNLSCSYPGATARRSRGSTSI